MTNTMITRNVNDSGLYLCGGTNWNSGGGVVGFGKEQSYWQGSFVCHSTNGTTECDLIGSPTGSLTWNGKRVAVAGDYLPLSGGIMTSYNVMGRNVTNSHLQIAGGTSDRDGAFLSLAGKDFSPRPGAFFMVARTADKVSYLQGNPNGSLIWNEKDIDVIEEQGDGYIRYSNGIQICWGYVNLNAVTNGTNNTTTVNFPKSFVIAPNVTATIYNAGDCWAQYTLAVTRSETSVWLTQWATRGSTSPNTTGNRCAYQAIGRWK